ncbi:MAG: polysaccharide deacetylase family protein [Flavobacteriaceae bacterium]|nr:polysaccharide deacetylase family protein [Flavobacteriaceae bacterium]
MHFYIVKTPNFIKSFFKDLVWSFTNSEKKLYLTFDDGPTSEITPFILEQLKKHNAKATFFCVGENIDKFPAIFQQIIEEGHTVGNHTNNHLNGWKTTTSIYLKNIEDSEKYFNENPKFKIQNSKLLRPPYGKIRFSQINKLKEKGFKIIMWDVLSGDFDINISKEKVLNNILKNTVNGSIIVMHDHHKADEKLQYCLPIILKHYTSLGFTFEKIK